MQIDGRLKPTLIHKEAILKRIHFLISCLIVVLLFGWGATLAHATPSTELWTPAIMDIQPFGVWHLGIDNYFTVGRGNSSNISPVTGASLPLAFPTDVGLTVGVLPFEKLNMEVGIDMLAPIQLICGSLENCGSVGDSLLFNTKIGVPEGALFTESPGINVGIFNVGTVKNVTDMDIVDLIVGKTIPVLGRIHVGGYVGNSGSALMHEGGVKTGSKENTGWMVAYDRGFVPVKDAAGNEYNKFTFLADYASGKNFIGGGAVGVGINFTKDIDVLTGPVFFNDQDINGRWKLTTQLDINF